MPTWWRSLRTKNWNKLLILHSKPWINEQDLKAVEDTLRGGMIAQGQGVKDFETLVSDWTGALGGVAVASGSAALELALLTLGIDNTSEVILPTYVCESVMEAVVSTGATPVLCDVGYNWVVEPANVASKISPRTAAIIIPHMYGIFADVKAFKKFNIPIIEDCAQAFGDKSIDKILADIAVLSFHPTKCLTCGEGGMMVSLKEEYILKARSIRDGCELANEKRLIAPLSDIQAALGTSQLKRYPEFLKRRREIAGKYLIHLAAISLKLVNYDAKASSMFFRLPLKVKGGLEKYEQPFLQKGIHIRKGVDKLLHRLMGLNDIQFPVATELFNETISIPLYPSLTDEEVESCIQALDLLKMEL